MKNQRFSISKRLMSFKHALRGVYSLVKEEHNVRIHLIATIIAIGSGLLFHISNLEWIALVMVIGFVITMEAINTVVENIADFISADIHPEIKKIKDIAAGAVLISALTAAIVGLLVFLPKVVSCFFR